MFGEKRRERGGNPGTHVQLWWPVLLTPTYASQLVAHLSIACLGMVLTASSVAIGVHLRVSRGFVRALVRWDRGVGRGTHGGPQSPPTRSVRPTSSFVR